MINQHYFLLIFDKYYGKTFFEDSIPIVPENAQWTFNKIECYRRQYPLMLSYASSIHKGQGLTIPKVIIDIGRYEFSCGITYVAITRARKLSDIIFKPFFPLRRLKPRTPKNTDTRYRYSYKIQIQELDTSSL